MIATAAKSPDGDDSPSSMSGSGRGFSFALFGAMVSELNNLFPRDNKARKGLTVNNFLRHLWSQVCMVVALLLWLGIFHFNTIAIVGALIYLPHPFAVTILVIYATLMVLPINEDSAFGAAIAAFIASRVTSYFPIKVVYEDREAIKPHRAHVIAFEPHSVLPIGAVAFNDRTGLTPFTDVRTLASSTLRRVPLARHLLTWMGMAAVTRDNFIRLLKEGKNCLVIPGGVQECLYMNNNQEVLFLKKRKGFIRLAITAGVPVVPTFAFGQRDVYGFWFPRQDWFYRLARKLRFAPLIFWGVLGGPVPFPRELMIVVGKPIEVVQKDSPSDEEVIEVQEKFLAAMQNLYDTHKAEAGVEHIELKIT